MSGSLTSPPPPEDRITIVCLYCDKPQEVSRRAMTVTCKFCNKSLRIEDLRFKEYQARRNIEMFQNAMRMFTPFPNAPQPAEPEPAPKAGEKSEDLKELKAQIAAMQRKIDSMG